VQREDRVTFADALAAFDSFTYLYDFGDGWEHHIQVEKVLPLDPELLIPA
jgi:hypothetical protein